MDRRAAALMALHAWVSSPHKSPYEAVHEGFDIELPIDGNALTPIPAWIVSELVLGIEDFVTGKADSLNRAFRVANGTKGQDTLKRPLEDLSYYQAIAIQKFVSAEKGGAASDADARAKWAEYAQNLNESGSTNGASEESQKRAQKRIRELLARYGFSSS